VTFAFFVTATANRGKTLAGGYDNKVSTSFELR
jgi:hypothetical protein